MLETWVVVTIVALVALWAARRLYRNFAGKAKTGCGAGCAGAKDPAAARLVPLRIRRPRRD